MRQQNTDIQTLRQEKILELKQLHDTYIKLQSKCEILEQQSEREKTVFSSRLEQLLGEKQTLLTQTQMLTD